VTATSVQATALGCAFPASLAGMQEIGVSLDLPHCQKQLPTRLCLFTYPYSSSLDNRTLLRFR
jgi:hypothetical protein